MPQVIDCVVTPLNFKLLLGVKNTDDDDTDDDDTDDDEK